jgi:hypothetical protein
MNRTRKRSQWTALLLGVLISQTAWSYSPRGPVPGPLKTPETPLWTRADVDAVVDVSYVTIDGYEPASTYGAPAACDKVSFLRFRNKAADGDPEHADADLLMVPGILEGANGFDFIGRQLVYIASKEYGKNLEVWAMDRRANCLEDLTGMFAAEQAPTLKQTMNILTGYYYYHKPVNGKTFAGFLTSQQLPFLYHFGMRQTTQDMFAIIQHMVPDADVRKKKVFVGGHSLGGVHTSTFLSWNLVGDASQTEYAGYNWCAGAFGFDTTIGPLATSTNSFLPPAPSEETYQKQLSLIESGKLEREIYVPGLLSPEIIALPQAAALLADLDPDGESTVLPRIPHSPELNGILGFINLRRLDDISQPPTFEEFRYTNQALIGLIFDDNFSPLSLLQAGLGFLHGGSVVKKMPLVESLAGTKGELGSLITQLLGTQPHYVAANAGPNVRHLGHGPLYQWARRDEIGSITDPDYTDTTGFVHFTNLVNEPSDIRDFTKALYEGPTNFTEWYFPLRLVVDSIAVGGAYAPKYGLDVDYPDGPTAVPSLLIVGDQGLTGYKIGDPPAFPQQQLIVAPGFTHLDPMFEAVNSPSQNDYVMRPLIQFVLAHAR